MAADPKLLTTLPEKPNHYTYLKEFRVEQCQSFLQHKCNQHRPFICFNWHFMNQRRRRPVRKRDGTFNYSADNYCAKYDETTGICPDGDECPFLHRTAGDTERRYHLRYYKTCMCVHDTDTRGYCVKNGHHCAFAHGTHDQRPPVFDIKEIEAAQAVDGPNGGLGGGGGGVCGSLGGSGGGMCGSDLLSNAPNALDKERNLMNEDPKWQDTNYVLANYKTEPCKRPPRLCRQGYACPQYHNSKDKRRSPRKFKYRSTPCPNVKHGEEWGEPANCEAGDNCQYCHTRTEQQFHPEIYKSTKCNDVQQAGYCPRSVFCAFAHVEPYIVTEEMQSGMDGSNGGQAGNLALGDLLSNVMHMDGNNGIGGMKKDRYGADGLLMQNGGSGESCESASTSSVGSNQSHSKAPGAQLHQNKHHMQQQQHMQHLQQQQQQHQHQQHQQHHNQHHLFQNSLNNNHSNANNNGSSHSNNNNIGIGNGLLNAVVGSALGSFPDFTSDLSKQLMAIENDSMLGALEKEQRKRMCLTFGLQGGVVGGSLDKFGSHMDDVRREFGSHMDNSISAGLASSGLLQHNSSHNSSQHNASQPMNIPGNSQLSDSLSGLLQGNSAPGHIPDNFSPNMFSNHFSHIGGSAPKMHNSFGALGNNGVGSLHGNDTGSMFYQPLAISPELGFNNSTLNGLGDMHRMRDELASQSVNWEDRILQASKACEAWRSEADESNRKAVIAEQQRDNALSHVQLVTEKLDQVNGVGGGGAAATMPRDLRSLSIQNLKGLQAKLRSDLEEVEKVLYLETATKCMKCEENNRSVTLVPCNHYVLCDQCAKTVRECPYCQTVVTSQA